MYTYCLMSSESKRGSRQASQVRLDDMSFLRHVFMFCWIVVRSRRLRFGRRLGSNSTGPDAAVPVQALSTPRLIQALGALEGELGQSLRAQVADATSETAASLWAAATDSLHGKRHRLWGS